MNNTINPNNKDWSRLSDVLSYMGLQLRKLAIKRPAPKEPTQAEAILDDLRKLRRKISDKSTNEALKSLSVKATNPNDTAHLRGVAMGKFTHAADMLDHIDEILSRHQNPPNQP